MLSIPCHGQHRHRQCSPERWLGFIVGLLCLLVTTGVNAADVTAVIDFDVESLPAGTVVSSIQANVGGTPAGPIAVDGFLPSHPAMNRAIIFDSSNPTGEDFDLGSPNQTFGGPGIGPGGEAGQPFENDTALGNLLIVAEDMVDADSDDLIDDPDDATEFGMTFSFDLSGITAPFVPYDVTVLTVTTIDGEESEAPGFVRVFDADDNVISNTMLVATGCNGVATHDIGAPGVGVSGAKRIEIEINGSGGIDDIVLSLTPPPPPVCTIDPGGVLDVEVGDLVTFDVIGETILDGESVVLDAFGLPASATMTPALPVSSDPEMNVTSTFEWTPTLADVGETLITFTTADAFGQESECQISINVTCTLSIDREPQGMTVCEGDPATVSVLASGTAPLSYQWRFEGAAIPGAKSSTFEIAATAPADSGSYDVVLSNPCGEVTSETVVLIVSSDPAITTSPTSTAVCSGESASFVGAATGAEPLTLAWYHDGELIAGASNATLTIDPAGPQSAGEYVLVASNDCGSASSSAAVLTVDLAPEIASGPTSQTLCAGGAAVFTVDASGTAPLSYQWWHDGSLIAGASAATLTINPVSMADTGEYYVVVTNDCGEATSGAASLIVQTAPMITSQPEGGEACLGTTVSLAVGAIGTPAPTYQWRLNGAAIDGATGPMLSFEATAGDSGSYDVVVSNPCGDVTSSAAIVTVLDGPTITASPSDFTGCEGDSAMFTVSATGSEPLGYQWYSNGAAIVGEESTTLTINPLTLQAAGEYTVVVSNSCGDATSQAATLIVESGPEITAQPAGGDFCVGTMVSLSVTASGTPELTYQWRLNGSAIDGASEPTLSFAAALGDSGSYDVVVGNSCGEVTSSAAIVSIIAATQITSPPAAVTQCEGEAATLSVEASGGEPLSYQWSHDGSDIEGATDASLTIDPLTPAAAGSYTVHVSGSCGAVDSEAALVSVPTAPVIVEGPGDVMVCPGEPAMFSVAVEGSPSLTIQWYKDGAPIPGARGTSYTIEAVTPADAGSYSIGVDNDCGGAESESATLSLTPTSQITADPEGGVFCVGDPLELSVVIDGDPQAIQWRHDGEEIPGGTTTTLDLATADIEDGGTYDVVITDDCGSTSSTAVEVVVEVCAIEFLRGECNDDGRGVNIADAVYILQWIFNDGPTPVCMGACDVNGDLTVNLADAIYLMQYILLDGPLPIAPFPNCGIDPTADCEYFESCTEEDR